MCGFRDPLAAAADIEALGVAELEHLVRTLRDPKAGLRRAVTDLLGLGREECRGIIDAAAKAAAELDTQDAADLVNLARSYPDDPGVLVSLLLNHITLQPGEGVYMPAGNLHAYLKGFGVEIMAASDNVLRGGLTNKRVDVPELLRVLDFRAMDEPRAIIEDAGPIRSWPVPIDDFALQRIELTGETRTLAIDGPRICLSTGGSVTVADDEGEVALSPGRAAFSAGTAGPLVASGEGELFIASA
jgi:mannose-6-phosphate isomerase